MDDIQEMKLYIIGNGFDRAHDLKTSYWDFRTYLKRYAEDFLIELEKSYGYWPYDPDEYHVPKEKQRSALREHDDVLYDELWKTFEEQLGHPDETEIDSVCDSAIGSLQNLESGPVQIEDTLNAYFREQFQFIQELQGYLLKWVKQIRLNKAIVKKNELLNNSTDLFLTFNYTPTLERVYKIDPSNICHIHGRKPPYCSVAPIIGHGNKQAIEQRRKWQHECEELFDEDRSSKNKAIADFYQRTFKDTGKALLMNLSFFNRINDVDSIEVIGHSLGDVDMPYFKDILERVGSDTPWIVYYYDKDKKTDMENMIRTIGVTQIRMEHSSKFWDR